MATYRKSRGNHESRFHEGWLGMVEQDGLVVSVPVLTSAGVMHQRGAGAQQHYRDLLAGPADDDAAGHKPGQPSGTSAASGTSATSGTGANRETDTVLELASLDILLHSLLEFVPRDIDKGRDLPDDLHVVATEATTNILLRPTAAIRRTPRSTPSPNASQAGPASDVGDDPFAAGDDDFGDDVDDPFAGDDDFGDDDVGDDDFGDDDFGDDLAGPGGLEKPAHKRDVRPAADRLNVQATKAAQPDAQGQAAQQDSAQRGDQARDVATTAGRDGQATNTEHPVGRDEQATTAEQPPGQDEQATTEQRAQDVQATKTEQAADPELSSAARVGQNYLALVWDLADPDTGFGPAALGRSFDRPDQEADWSYPPAAKFERLLRHTRVPIGLLTNRRQVRLIYAPHGETSGSLTFDLNDMGEVGGRPMLDAFLALLGRDRWLTQAEQSRLPALLDASRKQQAEVTERLADQVFDALQALLRGFEAASRRDGSDLLHRLLADGARSHGTGVVYAGLLTVLLRLVFTLYAEDRGLLPIEHPIYQGGYSLLGLFDELQQDQGAHPDAMDRRFGAWSRLLATWRAVYDGIHHHGAGTPLSMPPRRGHLFNPDAYPFLEGREVAAPLANLRERAAVAVPSIDDGTIFRMLDGLLYLREGKARQRLSYRALDVEQIGSVYEALMGYDVIRLQAPAVRLRARRAKGVWLCAAELLAVPHARRAKWLKEQVGLDKSHASKLAKLVDKALKQAGLKDSDKSQPAAEVVLATLAEHAGKGYGQRAAAGRLVIQPGDERKRTSSHYTPRELTEPVVRRTLAPLLRTIEVQTGAPPTSAALLNLKIVDPAMGSGAFLVETVRQLADHVVAAWQREGRYEAQGALLSATLGGLSREARPTDGSDEQADPVIAARRLVAQRCVYGVDKNPYAVNLAKLSLWLVTLSKHLPFTFVDHALRCGDSLVGLTLAQARAFDWRVRDDLVFASAGKKKRKSKKTKKPKAQGPDPLLAPIVASALNRATELRHQIVLLANQDGEQVVLEREQLLAQAREALEEARLLADVCLGAFFDVTPAKDKARQAERQRRFDVVMAWLGERQQAPGGPRELAAKAELETLRELLLTTQSPFHWMLEFPEVFWEGRVDPLVPKRGRGNSKKTVAYFDAVVGNPPFAGKNGVLAAGGDNYIDWLKELHPGAHGNADVCAHFFRRACFLLGPHGTFGLVGTNTIGQGDTRTTGLAAIVGNGGKIYDATVDLRWPAPGAAVTVSIVHLALGSVTGSLEQLMLRRLNPTEAVIESQHVDAINSRLAGRPERADPVSLASNDGLSFIGTYVLGQGFVLTAEEREGFITQNRDNTVCIKPYLGGAEVNRTPDLGFRRYVIDFGDRELTEVQRWPELFRHIRDRVKPEREKNNRAQYRLKWWWFGERRPALYEALSKISQCIITSQTKKHAAFVFHRTDLVFDQTLVVIATPSSSALSLLTSRAHLSWNRIFASSMETRLRYIPTDCFRNFPFPAPDPRTEHPLLEPLGRSLDSLRSAFMLDHQIGLTTTYNLLLGFDTQAAIADSSHKLHAPACDPRLAQLRRLHLDLDRAVLQTYADCLGNSSDPAERALADLFLPQNLAVPPYRDPRLRDLQPGERRALEAFNDAILDALMALNEVRAAAERRAAN